MKIYFVRHSETEWNYIGKLQGECDIPLSENGKKLARITGESKFMKEIHFDLIITSPLNRAIETAELIVKDDSIPRITDKRIREITWGEWDGLTPEEIEKKTTIDFDRFYTDPFAFLGAPGGETVLQVCQRGTEFLKELIHNDKYKDKTILVVTHGCAIRGILNSLYKNPADFWQGGVPDNCSVTEIEIQDEKIEFLQKDQIYYDINMTHNHYKKRPLSNAGTVPI